MTRKKLNKRADNITRDKTMTTKTRTTRVDRAVAIYKDFLKAERALETMRRRLKKSTEVLVPDQRIEYFTRTGRDRFGATK